MMSRFVQELTTFVHAADFIDDGSHKNFLDRLKGTLNKI